MCNNKLEKEKSTPIGVPGRPQIDSGAFFNKLPMTHNNACISAHAGSAMCNPTGTRYVTVISR